MLQAGFVNFQETDAWYHVRVAQNLVHHFPWRIMVDPYVTFGQVHDTATSPFYDWVLGFIAWIAGAGSPSESLLNAIAAWYPAVLGVVTVAAVFVLARFVFGLRAALIAAAIVATLPGHFLKVSSLGFTDHHIMESLLVTCLFLWLLQAIERRSVLRSLAAGLTLAAYLLTFHGSAMVVGIVVAWALYDRARSFRESGEPAPSFWPLYIAFTVALMICLPFRRLLWMNYSILTLALGGAAIGAVELWAKVCRRFRRPALPFYGALATACIAAAIAVLNLTGSVRHSIKGIVQRFIPDLFGVSGGVYELKSLVYDHGKFTLIPALQQYYGAYLLALLGMFLLAELLFKRVNRGRDLILFWGLATFVLAMGQLRMTYYYAIAVALLSGYAADVLFGSGRKTAWATGLVLVLLVFAPNVYAALNSDLPTGVSADWREALEWMRKSTPEPFGDPGFFYARYPRQQFGPDYRYPASAYSVMAWWDYGYWIVDVARRVPVTNPAQMNASVAADFFLSQTEQEAAPLLQYWRTRYVVVDERLPLWPSEGTTLIGDYPTFFEYAIHHWRGDYFMLAYEPDAEGKPAPKLFFFPAYYRSMAVRLFVFGGQAVDGKDGATILYLEDKPGPGGRPHKEIVEKRRYDSTEEATAAEALCRKRGCVLVGDNPMTSCVPLEPLQKFKPVFASSRSSIGFGSSSRKSVQVYEFTGAVE